MLVMMINNVWKHKADQALMAFLLVNFFALGPLLWFYARTVTGKIMSLKSPLVWLHLLPCIALQTMLATGLAPIDAAPANETVWFAENYQTPSSWTDVRGLLAGGAHLIAYLIGVTFIVRRNIALLKMQYSAIEHRSFQWLTRLAYALAALLIAWIMLRAYLPLLINVSPIVADLFLAMGYLGITSFCAVNGLHHQLAPNNDRVPFDSRRGTLVSGAALRPRSPVDAKLNGAQSEDGAAVKYSKSTLTAVQAAEIKMQLEALMATERCFLENDLTLIALANRLTVSPHNLSQVLNESMQTSFYDYVNKLRVAEAARCLRDPAYNSQTVFEIALASGFSSKTTFNTVFKRTTGLTPTAYRSNAPRLASKQDV
jgi:AraC-like DNA-binding protein